MSETSRDVHSFSVEVDSPLPLGTIRDVADDTIADARVLQRRGSGGGSGPEAIDADIVVTAVTVSVGHAALRAAAGVAEEEISGILRRFAKRLSRAGGVDVEVFGPDGERLSSVRRRQ